MDYLDFVRVKSQGFEAYCAGEEYDSNPHPTATDEYEAWHVGWIAAAEESASVWEPV